MEAKAEPSAGGLREQQDVEKLIAFFDLETTVPSSPGSRYFLLEFGAILVCPRRLVEVEIFSTLIRPSDLNAISPFSIRCNGITRDSVTTAPSFVDVADKVYSILHGRVWAGHNILKFDCVRIREAFAELGRSPPEPVGTIDTLPLLTQRFGRRAGNMKMATLANYFGLGPQKHRSLDDVRLNFEILKHCATVLFLESSVSDAFPFRSLKSKDIIVEKCNNQNEITVIDLEGSFCLDNYVEELSNNLDQSDHPLLNDDTICSTSHAEPMNIDSSQLNFSASVGRKSELDFIDAASYNDDTIKKLSSRAGFLEPNDILLQYITVGYLNHSPTVKKMYILHFNVPLWLYCPDLVIHFGISTKFKDYAGRPKLSILVNAPNHLCQVLRDCESLVQNSFRSYGSTSEWSYLIKKNDFTNSSTVRLQILTRTNSSVNDESSIYSTEIYRKEASGNMNKFLFSKFDAEELSLLLAPGTIIDGFLCFDVYNYQQNAGIRLLAKHLVIKIPDS